MATFDITTTAGLLCFTRCVSGAKNSARDWMISQRSLRSIRRPQPPTASIDGIRSSVKWGGHSQLRSAAGRSAKCVVPRSRLRDSTRWRHILSTHGSGASDGKHCGAVFIGRTHRIGCRSVRRGRSTNGGASSRCRGSSESGSPTTSGRMRARPTPIVDDAPAGAAMEAASRSICSVPSARREGTKRPRAGRFHASSDPIWCLLHSLPTARRDSSSSTQVPRRRIWDPQRNGGERAPVCRCAPLGTPPSGMDAPAGPERHGNGMADPHGLRRPAGRD